MGATSKQRTPSRCREWERERRNKFNQAVTKLGDLIRTAFKEGENTSKDADTTQYPKIEIIQRAIAFISDYLQEKTKLKAEILALQVKLQANKSDLETKDVSTQISRGIKIKLENDQYNKLLMIKKCKKNSFKGTTSIIKNDSNSGTRNDKTVTKPLTTDVETQPNLNQISTSDKLPKLLPKPNTFCDSKGTENTIVVMPATPFILPQRPLLFPTTLPTFVLFNQNMSTVNNSSMPIIGKKSNDNITKTTMVNILPISAYSRPLSASKGRKNNKLKSNNINKKIKPVKKQDETKKSSNETKKVDEPNKNTSDSNERHIEETDQNLLKITVTTECSDNNTPVVSKAPNTVVTKAQCIQGDTNIKTNKGTTILKELPDATNSIPSSLDNTRINKENLLPVTDTKVNKTAINKNSQPPEKVKVPNILEASLCESAVDVGNARLELAEELLAASPTAAFLMSFPLVSGNRADSPAEDTPPGPIPTSKDNQRNTNIAPQPVPYFEKTIPSEAKDKSNSNSKAYVNQQIKQTSQSNTKLVEAKASNPITATSSENPFLNLPMPSVISTSGSITDSTFAFDLDCNTSKSLPSQPTSYSNNNSLFYKSDPYNAMKNTIYSTSSISSGHDFNSLGLYPCAMEKYSSKTKPEYHNVDENLMKIGSSRLTYDIDLGWSQKGFDFVNSSTSAPTFNKDNLLTTASTSYTTSSYNPFTPDFHVPLVSTSSKKDSTSKPISSFADTIANFYSQSTSLWSDDAPFYTSNNISSTKSSTAKIQNYLPLDNSQSIPITKQSSTKQYETKHAVENYSQNTMKLPSFGMSNHHQVPEKYTKKSPSKMHINWMTSETRPMQNTYVHNEGKESAKSSYVQVDHVSKKQDHTDSNYFPISIHNYPSHAAQEEFQVWPSARPQGTTEISIDPPPINLPTLVGDLALGPHEKKKHAESNRATAQTDIQNCNNFLSVTQLMNRSTDNMSTRCEGPMVQAAKPTQSKQNVPQYTDRKSLRLDHIAEPCYTFNETKHLHPYDTTNQYPITKTKTTKSTDKNVKNPKHSYTAEALIRGGCTQKHPENKFAMAGQKYNDCNPLQDSSVAQVSHFPPILDYTDNSYSSQQFSGTTLYNSTTNTISNSFYSNFMPGSTNLMSSNYAGAPFSGEFLDYNQSAECNYQNQRYEEFKMKVNAPVYHHDKATNLKSSRRDFSAKHKLDCSKKESSKKYQSKRPKLSNEEDWTDSANLLWQNKTPSKRPMGEELPFPNYMGNQMPTQYQPDIFNSHLMPNVQAVGHTVDRSLASLPVTSRANFNLSTIFPEITMKVQ